MTQQSLITRLKAVEEALAMYHNFCHKTLGYSFDDAMVNFGDKSLSDLRELIKEAEGQAPTAYVRLEDWNKIDYEPEDCFDRVSSGFASTPLYTTLGEKP